MKIRKSALESGLQTTTRWMPGGGATSAQPTAVSH